MPPSRTASSNPLLDPLVLRRVRYRVRRLAEKFCLSEEDIEDLTQEFLLALHEALAPLDTDQSDPGPMITTVLNRRYCSHLRRLSGPQHREITDAIALEDVRPDYQFDLIDEHIETERRHDALRENVADRLQCLPAPLRRVAKLLMHHNPTTVARMLGVHNSSIYRSMQEIRTVFEEGGIEDFSQFHAEISGVLRKTSGEGTTPETRKDGAETT